MWFIDVKMLDFEINFSVIKYVVVPLSHAGVYTFSIWEIFVLKINMTNSYAVCFIFDCAFALRVSSNWLTFCFQDSYYMNGCIFVYVVSLIQTLKSPYV